MKCYSILISALILLNLVSCRKDPIPPVLPTEIDNTVTVSYHGARVSDHIRYSGAISTVRILYSTDSNVGTTETGVIYIAHPEVEKEDGIYHFSVTLSNLTDDCTYYYVYEIVSSYDLAHNSSMDPFVTSPQTFRTLSNEAPIVETVGCSEFGFHAFKLDCAFISYNSDDSQPTWGICYSTRADVDINSRCMYANRVIEGDTVTLASDIKLQPGTQYYYRAFAENRYGVSYGDLRTITTVSATVMDVVTIVPTVIQGTLAVLCGNVISHATLEVSEKGFYISDSDTDPGEDDTRLVSAVTDEGSYQCQAVNLQPGRKYYYRAYATCQYGTLVGNILSFTTPN